MATVPDEAFDGVTREALIAEIRAHAGATVADLSRAVSVAHTTATYHLRRLEKQGAVVSLRAGGRLHFFLNGQATPKDRTLTVCRRLERSEEVLRRLPRDAPVTLGEVSAGLPMTKAGVYWHLLRLAALGLVVAEGPPGARRYRAAAP